LLAADGCYPVAEEAGVRNVLAVVAVAALFVASVSVLSSWLVFGLAVAVSAGCVTALECVAFVERRRDEWRLGREQVWMRRGL
jgi:hypothetical protein